MARRLGILLFVLITCVGCDQGTKHLAKNALELGEVHSYLADSVRIVYAENTGSFLGIGSSLPGPIRLGLFSILPVVLIIGMLSFVLFRPEPTDLELVAGSLFIAGGLGNIIDRVLHDGIVIDFLNVGIGPLRTGIFNVADMALMVGLALFLLASRKPAL